MRRPREVPKAGEDSSRGRAAREGSFRRVGAVGALVLAVGVAAALLTLLTEVTNVVEIDVAGAGCEDAVADPAQAADCELTGGDQHSYALVLVAVFIAVMAVGAGLGGSRPAAVALVAAGALVLGIALIGDLPDTSSTGQVGRNFTDAQATKGIGFWLELGGGTLAVFAGALRLLRPWRPQPREPGGARRAARGAS